MATVAVTVLADDLSCYNAWASSVRIEPTPCRQCRFGPKSSSTDLHMLEQVERELDDLVVVTFDYGSQDTGSQ